MATIARKTTDREQLNEANTHINKLNKELKNAEEKFQDVQHKLDKTELILKNIRERNVYVETILAKLIK